MNQRPRASLPGLRIPRRSEMRHAIRRAAWRLSGAIARLAQRIEVRCLMFRANSTQRYLDACRPDGLDKFARNVTAFRSDMEADYTRAAALKRELQRGAR